MPGVVVVVVAAREVKIGRKWRGSRELSMSMQFAWSTANIDTLLVFPLSSSSLLLLLLSPSPLARTLYNKRVEGGKTFRRVCNLMGLPLLFMILFMFSILLLKITLQVRIVLLFSYYCCCYWCGILYCF